MNQILSKPQLNHNSTQPNITSSWVGTENDFAHPPTPQKLNIGNISAVTDPISILLTLNVGSRESLGQIPPVTVTLV